MGLLQAKEQREATSNRAHRSQKLKRGPVNERSRWPKGRRPTQLPADLASNIQL